MTGPYTFDSRDFFVRDSETDIVAKVFNRTDGERIAADLNLADSVIAALGIRHQGGMVVKFDLGQRQRDVLEALAPEDRIDYAESFMGDRP